MAFTMVKTAFEQIYGQVSGKQKANEWYKLLVPEIHEALENGTPLTDPQLAKLIEALINLAPVGARRINFTRKYTEDRDSLLRLPLDPEKIMYGYWW